MTSLDLLWACRELASRLRLVGMDVVEVIPTGVGSADVTALVAERVVREVLTGIARSPSRLHRRAPAGAGTRHSGATDRLESRAWRRLSWTERRLGSDPRRGRAGGRAARPRRARDRARRRRPGVARLRRLKHKASHEAGIDSRDHRFPTRRAGGGDPRAHRRAERRRRGRRDPRPAPAAGAHGRAAVTCAVDPAEGRRRLPSRRTRASLPRRAVPRPRDARRACMVMLAEYGVELKGKEAVVIGRSEIVGKPMAMLLLAEHATVTICHSRTADLAAARAASRRPRRRGRPAGDRDARHGEAGRDGDRRRRQPHGRRELVGDVDPAVFEVAGLMTPGSGRRRADDDRDASAQHGDGCATIVARACVSRS